MKKFTFLLAALFCSFTISAQELVVEELWNHSYGGTEENQDDPFLAKNGYAPDYIGDRTERSIAYYDGKLYLPSRKDEQNRIAVVDANDGTLIKYIKCPESVTGGTFAINQIAIDENGIMVLVNLSTSAEAPPRVYTANLDSADPEITLAFEVPNPNAYRLGDGIGFYGYFDEGESILLLPVAENYRIIKVDINNGQYVSSREILLKDEFVLGTAPVIIDINENDFVVKGTQLHMTRFNYDADLIEQIALLEDGTPHLGLNGGKFFSLKDQEYLVAIATNSEGAPLGSAAQGYEGIFEILEVPADGMSGNMELVAFIPSAEVGLQGRSGSKQDAAVAPVAVDEREDEVYIYLLYPKNGVAAYKMYYDTGDNISKTSSSSLGAYPNPAKDVLNIAGDPALVEFYSVAGQKVMSVENQNSINVASLQGIYLVKIIDKSGESLTVKVSVK